MKKKVILMFLLMWVLTVAVTIFLFSSQTGEESGDVSRGLMEKILSIFRLKKENGEKLHHMIRKAAHMMEYALLGVSVCVLLLYLAGMGYPKRASHFGMAVSAWFFSVLFAVTDEIHQYFVPGRGPAVKDVLIDAVGAAVGIVTVLAVRHLVERRRHLHEKILVLEKEKEN